MEEKISDIHGRLLTTRSLIEMVGQQLLNKYGKDPKIEEAYKQLVKARSLVIEAKEKLPTE